MNAYKKYSSKILNVEGADEYFDYFDEAFNKNYKGEGDPEEDAAFDAFQEAAQAMELDGVIDDADKL